MFSEQSERKTIENVQRLRSLLSNYSEKTTRMACDVATSRGPIALLSISQIAELSPPPSTNFQSSPSSLRRALIPHHVVPPPITSQNGRPKPRSVQSQHLTPHALRYPLTPRSSACTFSSRSASCTTSAPTSRAAFPYPSSGPSQDRRTRSHMIARRLRRNWRELRRGIWRTRELAAAREEGGS
jgi:hypothetical protein